MQFMQLPKQNILWPGHKKNQQHEQPHGQQLYDCVTEHACSEAFAHTNLFKHRDSSTLPCKPKLRTDRLGRQETDRTTTALGDKQELTRACNKRPHSKIRCATSQYSSHQNLRRTGMLPWPTAMLSGPQEGHCDSHFAKPLRRNRPHRPDGPQEEHNVRTRRTFDRLPQLCG
jgi:hypothetical protein